MEKRRKRNWRRERQNVKIDQQNISVCPQIRRNDEPGMLKHFRIAQISLSSFSCMKHFHLLQIDASIRSDIIEVGGKQGERSLSIWPGSNYEMRKPVAIREQLSQQSIMRCEKGLVCHFFLNFQRQCVSFKIFVSQIAVGCFSMHDYEWTIQIRNVRGEKSPPKIPNFTGV